MKFRKLFGTVMSGGLAYAVLRLIGLFHGQAGMMDVVAGVVLTGLYLVIFWSGVTGWSSRKPAPELTQVTWSEEEFAEETRKAA